MLTNLHAIIFTNRSNYESNLNELTAVRSMSSVPYGGRYRLIDFMLSNVTNAGIADVGLVLQENYQSLLDHVESGKDWDLARKRGGLRLLPPFSQKPGSGNPKGRIEALANLGSYVADIKQEYVLLADGDVAINIDLNKVFEHHLSTGADVTPVVTSRYTGEPECTVYYVDKGNGKYDIVHGPDEATGMEDLNIYIMSKEFLLKQVKEAATHSNFYSMVKHVLLPNADKLNIVPYVFDGFAARITSVASYFKRSMELLKPEVLADLFTPARPVFSKDRTDASSYYAPESKVTNSIVSDGCIIEGVVENCILFRNVKIGKGCVVKNCILMKDVEVGENTSLNYVIADKNVSISANSTLGGAESYPLLLGKGSKV
jgi:glucose-1-phosphate adenylyltransferase